MIHSCLEERIKRIECANIDLNCKYSQLLQEIVNMKLSLNFDQRNSENNINNYNMIIRSLRCIEGFQSINNSNFQELDQRLNILQKEISELNLKSGKNECELKLVGNKHENTKSEVCPRLDSIQEYIKTKIIDPSCFDKQIHQCLMEHDKLRNEFTNEFEQYLSTSQQFRSNDDQCDYEHEHNSYFNKQYDISEVQNIDIKGKDGQTLLILAAGRGHINTCKYLIERGASINEYDNSGQTALIKAAINDFYDVCKLLVESGCRTDAIDKEGYTALQYSEMNKNHKLSDYLKLHSQKK